MSRFGLLAGSRCARDGVTVVTSTVTGSGRSNLISNSTTFFDGSLALLPVPSICPMGEASGHSRSTQIAPALIGLVGVLIGALTTSGIAYLGAQHRRHDDKRVAFRLITAEIISDEISAASFVEHGRAPSPPFSTAAWSQEQGTLARYATRRQWDYLAAFYIHVQNIESRVRGRSCLEPPERNLGYEAIRLAKSTTTELGRRPFDPHLSTEHRC